MTTTDPWQLAWIAISAVALGLVILTIVGGRVGGSSTAVTLPDVTEPPGPSGEAARQWTITPSLRGVTVGGADFGAKRNLGLGSGDPFSNTERGTLWSMEAGGSYRYPDPDSLTFLASRDLEVVRLTFRWERIRPDLDGPLDPGELALLTDTIVAANEAGLLVIPTLMNYGAYWIGVDGVGIRGPIGSEEVPVEALAETWRLLTVALDEYDNIAAYGLMNEPVGVHGGSAGWELASIAAVEAIRDTGSTRVVAVPTYQWSNVHRVVAEHPRGPWIDESLGPYVYEVHQYFTAVRSGAYEDYAVELADAQSEGWAAGDNGDALTERSVGELEAFIEWLDGDPGWVGEVGWPNNNDVAQWNQLASIWFEAANEADLWVTVWTTGAFWRNDYHLLTYRSSTGASGVLDSPTATASVLENNLE